MEQQQQYQSKKNTTELSKGRIPPQAIDFEETILGAMLIDSSAIPEVFHLLSEEVFYKDAHKHIFTAIREVYLGTDAVDILTVCNQLRKNGQIESVGGEYQIIELSQKVSSSAHIEFHARVVLQKYIQRQVITNSSKLTELAFQEDTDVFDLIDTAYSHLNEVSEVSVKPQEAILGSLLDDQIEKARQIGLGNIKPGIPTPISRMTLKTGGWRASELIILAARPGMGKTALAIKYGMHAARLGYPTAFFSMEMSKEQLTNRIISSEARIDSDKFTNTGLTAEEAERALEATRPIRETKFIIDDTASMSIDRFMIEAKRMKRKYGIKLIIVDYLQLMTGSNGKGSNREQEISKISRGMKLTAKELNIPVIALSQLSRAVESRGGSKTPMLSDLRESGAIEQDADVVQFIYRPEYYNIREWDEYDHRPTENEAEYIVAKNRNGGLVRNRMKFEKEFTNFEDLEEEYNPAVPPMSNYQEPEVEEDDEMPF